MIVKKTLLASVLLLFSYAMFSTKMEQTVSIGLFDSTCGLFVPFLEYFVSFRRKLKWIEIIQVQNQAEETSDNMDKELMAKMISVVLKCFKDADWDTCGEMLTTKYDITQAKYKKCTCDMACIGEDLGMINDQGEPVFPKFLEYVNKIHNAEIKGQLQNFYDKCNTIRGTDKCDMSEKYTACLLKETPKLKEKMIMLLETLKNMKPK